MTCCPKVLLYSHPIRLLGLGVSNPGSPPSNGEQTSSQGAWCELELEFEPWPDWKYWAMSKEEFTIREDGSFVTLKEPSVVFGYGLQETEFPTECCRIHFNNKTNRLLSPVQYLLAAKIRISERKSKFIRAFPSMSTAQRYKKNILERPIPQNVYVSAIDLPHI